MTNIFNKKFHYIKSVLSELIRKEEKIQSLTHEISYLKKKLNNKNSELSRLEIDLEHAVQQCRKIASTKNSNNPKEQWITKKQPGLMYQSPQN